MIWSDSFYEDCFVTLQDWDLDRWWELCETLFPDKWWEDIAIEDIIGYLKNDADIEIKGSYALVILHKDHKNLSFEVELTKEELIHYCESMQCH